MRSRYAAFSVGDADYLWRTLHSQHEARAGDPAAYAQSVQHAARTTRYRRLRVLDTRPVDATGVAQVLYYAEITAGKLDRSIVELSTFAEEEGQWRYLAGTARAANTLAHGPDDLSIDHWDCDHAH
ncbi:MAG: YchJ family metal-binding protein [Myxococcales bacterium]|nr:YchJ family metal-binding protein [Myxococcales bacterium]